MFPIWLPSFVPGKAANGNQSTWTSVPNAGDQDAVPSQLLFELAVVTIWGAEQWMEGLCLSLSLKNVPFK